MHPSLREILYCAPRHGSTQCTHKHTQTVYVFINCDIKIFSYDYNVYMTLQELDDKLRKVDQEEIERLFRILLYYGNASKNLYNLHRIAMQKIMLYRLVYLSVTHKLYILHLTDHNSPFTPIYLSTIPVRKYIYNHYTYRFRTHDVDVYIYRLNSTILQYIFPVNIHLEVLSSFCHCLH